MADDESGDGGFIPLKAVTAGAPDAASALAEIRQIYFRTSSRTIDNDFAHAIALLKSLPDEDARAKAHVYMEGLAELAREWATAGSGKSGQAKIGNPRGKRRERRKQP
jgi:hypothetical protein